MQMVRNVVEENFQAFNYNIIIYLFYFFKSPFFSMANIVAPVPTTWQGIYNLEISVQLAKAPKSLWKRKLTLRMPYITVQCCC